MKRNCFFYYEEQDMGASIPTCNYYFRLGYCPCNKCKKYIDKGEVYSIVKARVDAGPKPSWIPCSERLPDFEEKSYWVCTRTGHQFSCKWKRYEPLGNWTWHTTATVIAWMPLPEPWRGDAE